MSQVPPVNHDLVDDEIRALPFYKLLRESAVAKELDRIGFREPEYLSAGEYWAISMVRQAMIWLENPDSRGEPGE